MPRDHSLVLHICSDALCPDPSLIETNWICKDEIYLDQARSLFRCPRWIQVFTVRYCLKSFFVGNCLLKHKANILTLFRHIFYLSCCIRFHKGKRSKDSHPCQDMQVSEFEQERVRVSIEVFQQLMVYASLLLSPLC